MYYDWKEWGEVKKLTHPEKNKKLTDLERKWKKWLRTNHVIPICLTLKDAKDQTRMKRVQQEFERIGLAPFMNVFYARRPYDSEIQHLPSPKHARGVVGCWFSHLSIMDWMSNHKQMKRALIFEDDVVFNKDTKTIQKFFQNSTRVLETKGENLDLFYLGHLPVVAFPSDLTCSAWRVCSLLTHAYLIQPKVMKALVDDRYKKGEASITKAASDAIDATYFRGGKPDGHQFRAYANFPMIAPTQASSTSDIQGANSINTTASQKGPALMEATWYFIIPALILAIVFVVVCLCTLYFLGKL